MFCSFAKALNYIFLFISLQKEAAKKYFLAASLFYRKPIKIIGDKRRERNGVNERIADNQQQGFYSKHPTFTFQLLFLPPFIYKVCYNEHAKCNEAVTNLVAVNRYLFYELLLGFNAGHF